jgi:glucose-6-phosphate dehydrogenase assembly protein OpcA
VAPALSAGLGSIAEIQRELRRLRDAAGDGALPATRTSVMTHVAWVPAPWRDAAVATLEGLAEEHPSRTILLFPEPDATAAGLLAGVELRTFGTGGREICSEVISVVLRGEAAAAPASVVMPLLRSDLPVFLRWRGEPDDAPEALAGLAALADRLIVDSREWAEPGEAYRPVRALFEALAVSDIAWARTEPWRAAAASLWPAIAGASEVTVAAPRAEALLLAGWLTSRLGRAVALTHEEAAEIERVRVGDAEAQPRRLDRITPSDLLSLQLEIFTRDPIFEQAVRAIRA